MRTLLTIAALMTFMAIAPAKAQNVEVIGIYDDWTAYSFMENSGKVCYMASTPKKDEGKYTRRGDIFAIITHRPAEKEFDVVNFVAGYTYKPDSQVRVKIGRDEFTLFTNEDNAWALNSSTDETMVKTMIKGNRMEVHGISSRGTHTKDTYSLSGFTNAHNAINRACNK